MGSAFYSVNACVCGSLRVPCAPSACGGVGDGGVCAGWGRRRWVKVTGQVIGLAVVFVFVVSGTNLLLALSVTLVS